VGRQEAGLKFYRPIAFWMMRRSTLSSAGIRCPAPAFVVLAFGLFALGGGDCDALPWSTVLGLVAGVLMAIPFPPTWERSSGSPARPS